MLSFLFFWGGGGGVSYISSPFLFSSSSSCSSFLFFPSHSLFFFNTPYLFTPPTALSLPVHIRQPYRLARQKTAAQSCCGLCLSGLLKRGLFVGCLLACLTSQQHASVSQGRICSDNLTCCHTEIEVADPTFYLTPSQYTDTGPTSPSTDPVTPGAWQGSHWSANFQVTGMTRPGKIPLQAGCEPRIFRSRGGRLNHLANEAVLRGEDIKEWTGFEWNIILQKAGNREEWRKLVVKSTVVPQR